MNKLILCEGKTDAILLSYYLQKTCGWAHHQPLKNINIKADDAKGESAYWYKKDNEFLLICGVGGRDKFRSFFSEKLLPAITDSDAFSRIAVVTDRDQKSEEEMITDLRRWFTPIITEVKNNSWVMNHYTNSYQMKVEVDVLMLLIPLESQGALETLLLEAISEQVEDREIVTQSKEFVDKIQPVAKRYLATQRLKLKSYLGVTWAIQSPEKVFSFIDEQLKSVKWEDSMVLAKCFQQLKGI